uniref:Uncharacterized protein n=1 Tax=Leersia perrieri TaxID=77586 RepID=A0A0D9WJ61_9ORYZ
MFFLKSGDYDDETVLARYLVVSREKLAPPGGQARPLDTGRQHLLMKSALQVFQKEDMPSEHVKEAELFENAVLQTTGGEHW